jgi:transcription antitermination factor NusG
MLTPLRRRPDKISHGWSPARGTNTRKGSPHESVKVFKCHTSTSMDLGCFTKSRGAPKSGQFRRAVPPLKRAARPWPFIHQGDKVRVERGPLLGVEGVVTSADDKERLVVSVSLLQRSIAVEMDHTWVSAQ